MSCLLGQGFSGLDGAKGDSGPAGPKVSLPISLIYADIIIDRSDRCCCVSVSDRRESPVFLERAVLLESW